MDAGKRAGDSDDEEDEKGEAEKGGERKRARTLPRTVATGRSGARTGSGANTRRRKRAFSGVWSAVIGHYPSLAHEPATSAQACWRAVIAHKFTRSNPGDGRLERNMETALRWHLDGVLWARRQHAEAVAAPQPPPPGETPSPPELPAAPAPPQARQQQEERQLSPDSPPSIMSILSEPAPQSERRDRPDPAPAIRTTYGAALQAILLQRDRRLRRDRTDVDDETLRSMPIDELGDVLAEGDVALIERAFAIRGVGQAGRACPVCCEVRGKFARFSKGCAHEYCAECVARWVRRNAAPAGALCPGCVADKAAVPRYVDPCVVFGDGKGIAAAAERVSFSSFQLPSLQGELDAEPATAIVGVSSPLPPVPIAGRCPLCMTLAPSGKNSLRRCQNPRCAAVYCVACESAVEEHAPHLRGACSLLSAETKKLAGDRGMSSCPKCGTAVWHARRHGCHHVRCPTCATEFCHACGLPRGDANCACPLFCGADFACRCAAHCPECASAVPPCAHCEGMCADCIGKRITGIVAHH